MWIQASLVSRRQRVVVNGYSSDWSPVSSSVPQGSILGLLLFLLYVNDIGAHLKSQISLFADDCTIFREIASRDDCEVLQSDLHKLCEWTCKWQLHLNLSKCKTLCISNKRIHPTFTYHLSGAALEWVDSILYLARYAGQITFPPLCNPFLVWIIMGALSWLNAETLKILPTSLFGRLARCSGHGHFFAGLQDTQYSTVFAQSDVQMCGGNLRAGSD